MGDVAIMGVFDGGKREIKAGVVGRERGGKKRNGFWG
jgi:hypothetical protein